MGLDMYLFKIKKPRTATGEVITKEWIEERGYSYILEDDINSDLSIQLKPYTEQCKIDLEFIDIEKIAEDNDIKLKSMTGWYNSVIAPSFRIFTFNYNGIQKEVEVTIDEIEEKYLISRREKVYLFESIEVYYWRKCYDMQEFIYNLFDNRIRNCEYKTLTMEQLIKIREFERKRLLSEGYLTGNFEIAKAEEDAAYFYYEWY